MVELLDDEDIGREEERFEYQAFIILKWLHLFLGILIAFASIFWMISCLSNQIDTNITPYHVAEDRFIYKVLIFVCLICLYGIPAWIIVSTIIMFFKKLYLIRKGLRIGTLGIVLTIVAFVSFIDEINWLLNYIRD